MSEKLIFLWVKELSSQVVSFAGAEERSGPVEVCRLHGRSGPLAGISSSVEAYTVRAA